MRSPFSPGDAVRARGRTWRLRDVTEHAECVELQMEAFDTAGASTPTVLLHPFDRVSPAPNADRPRAVPRGAFWRSLAHRTVTLRAHDTLVSPAAAALDILPYQLEPAIALVLDGATRVLVADAVGLGKTVQAGIALAESLARGHAARALVLVPAALRDQWLGELRSRFGLDAEVVDAPSLRATGSRLPRTVSPWLVPRVAIVSIDFAKRAEVLRRSCGRPVGRGRHRRSPRRGRGQRSVPRRRPAGQAREASHPADRHAPLGKRRGVRGAGPAGRRHSIRAPCLLPPIPCGREGPRRAAFPPADACGSVRPSARRSNFCSATSARSGRRHRLRIGRRRSSSRYCSSNAPCLRPESLLRSIVRRRALLCARDDAAPGQLLLPLDDDQDSTDEEPGSALGVPGLPALPEEVAWLDQLSAAAAAAARESRKLGAVERLVRRSREPLIVFTEYRDTLASLEHRLRRSARCVLLHGGLDRAQRLAVLNTFASGGADVLLATDAAGVGLNLHQRCRAVVNLEVPWNPVRLEQRLGRVDRLGQSRTVHAIHLVGRASPEERVLARLVRRAARASAALAEPESAFVFPVPPDDEVTAEALLGLAGGRSLWSSSSRGERSVALSVPALQRWDLGNAATNHALFQRQLRRIHAALRATAGRPRGGRRVPGVMVAMSHPGRRPTRLLPGSGTGILAVFEHGLTDASGRVVDEGLLPFAATNVCLHRQGRSARAFARAVARTVAERLGPHADEAAGRRARHAARHLAEAQALGVERLQALARDANENDSLAPPPQPGLFDHRAEHEAERALTRRAAWTAARRPHDDAVGSATEFRPRPPRLRWVYVQWPSPGSRTPALRVAP